MPTNRIRAKAIEIRGARDLAALWSNLPAAALRYSMADLPSGLGILTLGNQLRAAAWRERCASGLGEPCIERDEPCTYADSGRCRADALIPLQQGGGAPQWRMATLFVQWRPHIEELRLLALGETARDELTWAAQVLRSRFGLQGGEATRLRSFGDMMPARGKAWRLEIVTPWVIGKQGSEGRRANGPLPPDPNMIAAKLREGVGARAHKLTALCGRDLQTQRLGGHLARYVSEAMLALAILIRHSALEPVVIKAADLGHKTSYDALAWVGSLELAAEDQALPWLGLIEACGIGENVDKGFGQVELVRIAD